MDSVKNYENNSEILKNMENQHPPNFLTQTL